MVASVFQFESRKGSIEYIPNWSPPFKFFQNGFPNPGRSHKNIIIYLKVFFTEHLKNKDTEKIYGLMQIIIFL